MAVPPHTAATRSHPPDGDDLIAIFRQFDAYAFDADADFMAGVQAMTSGLGSGSGSAPALDADVMDRLKLYYFGRRHPGFDTAAYAAWCDAGRPGPSIPAPPTMLDPPAVGATVHGAADVGNAAAATAADARTNFVEGDELHIDVDGMAHPRTLQAVMTAVREGRPIAGIRQIPLQLNPQPSAPSQCAPVPKPWERP